MEKVTPLLPGEQALPQAPSIHISGQQRCVPQHYLTYNHTRQSVESIILDIEYDQRFLLLVGEESKQIYLQVGIAGFDNYKPLGDQQAYKLVYGRKWRVEPQLPSSEIIQTAYLALQKAREHEARELFRLRYNSHFFTPFNSHHDLPLMAQNSHLIRNEPAHLDAPRIADLIARVTYDGASLQLVNIEARAAQQWLIELDLIPSKQSQLPEMKPMRVCLLLDQLTTNAILYGLMDKFLQLSNQHVETHFSYKGFHRFCRQNSLLDVGLLSVKTRRRESTEVNASAPHDVGHRSAGHRIAGQPPSGVTVKFSDVLDEANSYIDKSRVPDISDGPLKEKIRKHLASLDISPQYMGELMAN